MRLSWLLLAAGLLAACGGITRRTPTEATSVTALPSRPYAEPALFTDSCEDAAYQLLRIADGRIEPVLFCN